MAAGISPATGWLMTSSAAGRGRWQV